MYIIISLSLLAFSHPDLPPFPTRRSSDLSATTEVIARTICFLLENVHPSKVFVTSTGVNPSFSSQEPRRPRFSFFYLHNVKELTSLPSRARTSVEANASGNSCRANDFLSGCPADRLPFQKSLNSGSEPRSASSTWRVVG